MEVPKGQNTYAVNINLEKSWNFVKSLTKNGKTVQEV